MRRLIITAAALWLSTGAALAQLAAPIGGAAYATVPGLGAASAPTSAGLSIGRAGIPLGATEQSTPGLSPLSGLSPLASPLVIPPIGAVGAGSAGAGSAPSSMPPSSAPANPLITNFGTGGMQQLPGAAPRVGSGIR